MLGSAAPPPPLGPGNPDWRPCWCPGRVGGSHLQAQGTHTHWQTTMNGVWASGDHDQPTTSGAQGLKIMTSQPQAGLRASSRMKQVMRLQGGKRSFNETEGKELGFIYIFKQHPDEMLVFQSTLAQPIASSVHCLHAKKGQTSIRQVLFY